MVGEFSLSVQCDFHLVVDLSAAPMKLIVGSCVVPDSDPRVMEDLPTAFVFVFCILYFLGMHCRRR